MPLAVFTSYTYFDELN